MKDKKYSRLQLQHVCAYVETKFDERVKIIRCNNGFEFHMLVFFASKGIIHKKK